jgi:hypothetical protein
MNEFTPGSKHWLRVYSGGTYGRTDTVQDTVVKVTPKRIHWSRSGQTDLDGCRRGEVRPATAEEIATRRHQVAVGSMDAMICLVVDGMVKAGNLSGLVAAADAIGAEVPAWIRTIVNPPVKESLTTQPTGAP